MLTYADVCKQHCESVEVRGGGEELDDGRSERKLKNSTTKISTKKQNI
jgi:hypothetical protein